MHQHLFRGKQKDFGIWVEGSLIVEFDGTCHITTWKNELIEPENNFYEMVDEMHEVIPETVGRFINMFDKSEAKIFEGDIVKCYDNSALDPTWGFDKIHIGVITETPPCYSLKIPGKLVYDTPCVKRWENDIYLDQWCNAENIEVIGNFHDNPELVNQPNGGALNMNIDPNVKAEEATQQENAQESASQDQAMEMNTEEGGVEG